MSRLPTDPAERKNLPLAAVSDYFDLALVEIARVIAGGNKQHNPGAASPVWDRSKSTDHADCLQRHFLERGTVDTDGLRHTAKLAWRALAMLQLEVEAATGAVPSRASVNCGGGRVLSNESWRGIAHEPINWTRTKLVDDDSDTETPADDFGVDANGSPVGSLKAVPEVAATRTEPEQLELDFSSVPVPVEFNLCEAVNRVNHGGVVEVVSDRDGRRLTISPNRIRLASPRLRYKYAVQYNRDGEWSESLFPRSYEGCAFVEVDDPDIFNVF